jgi:hypothetical protein
VDAGIAKISEFNSQELLKFLWSTEKCGVVDDKLESVIAKKQKISYDFPLLSENSDYPKTIFLSSQAPGRKLRGTGVAAWEASFVLADWLTRQKNPKISETISEILNLDEFGRIRGAKETAPKKLDDGYPGKKFPELEGDWSTWRGKKVVELGAGLGLPSIVSSFLGMRTVSTDGDSDVIFLLSENIRENSEKGKNSEVFVKKLRWGKEDPMSELGITCVPDLVMAADVVYGKWRAEGQRE